MRHAILLIGVVILLFSLQRPSALAKMADQPVLENSTNKAILHKTTVDTGKIENKISESLEFGGEPSSFTKELIKMICCLLLVICAILVLFTLMRKKFSIYGNQQNRTIQIIEMHPLLGKKALCLIEVENKKMLLGVTEENITLLCHLEKGIAFDKTLQDFQKKE